MAPPDRRPFRRIHVGGVGRARLRRFIGSAPSLPPSRLQAAAAKARLLLAGPLAAELYDHFLGGSGSDWTIKIWEMVMGNAVRKAMSSRALTGTTRIEQDEYEHDNFRFAYAALDC